VAAKYDIEKLLTDFQTFLVANLSAKLAAITTEKGDSLTLAVPVSGAYFIQTMKDKEAVYDPYVHIAAVDVENIPAQGALAKIYTVNIMIVVADEGQDPNLVKRMFRYLRALEELFTQNFTATRADVKLLVDSIVPVPLTEFGSGNFFKATGVSIRVALA
jgi:hypothetical protein